MIELIIIGICGFYIYSKFSTPKTDRKKRKIVSGRRKAPGFSQANTAPVPTNTEKKSLPPSVPHKKSEYLTTANERKFHTALLEALPDGYTVHCQTALMALVQPVDRKNNSRTWAKRMDFVITDLDTRIVAVIELDDSSHARHDRQKRDYYVNQALDGHHQLLRVQSSRTYCPSFIKSLLANIEDFSHQTELLVAMTNKTL